MVTNHRAVLFAHINMIEQLFFELIRAAIGTQDTLSRPPSKGEWAELYAMAKKQSLVGICFAGLQKLYNSVNQEPSTQNPQPNSTQNQEPRTQNLDEVQYLTWMGMAAKIQQRNEVVNKQCVEVQQMIEKEGFRTFIMKGQGNSALYRASYDPSTSLRNQNENDNLCLLRQSGDIDIYLEGGFEKVNAFVQRTYPTNEVNELEIHYHCLPDTEVEIHYRPFIMRNPFKNRKLQRFFAEEGEKCFENMIALSNGAGEIAVPTTTFNLVHQMVHIYHHLFTEGIGLRQLLDYYFLLRSVKSVENVNKSKECIHSLGLDSFASALMWVIAHVFANENENQNENENFYPWEPCEKDGQFLLNEIMLAGNFGKYDERLSHEEVTKWQSFWRVNARNLRLMRFNKTDWFWGPLWRIYHFAWRKIKGFE